MELCQSKRGEMTRMEYLSPERVELVYAIPLAEVVHRLLRPAEEPDQGLRQPGLRAEGLRHGQPGAGRHPDQPRARATPSRPSCTGPSADTYGRKMAEKLRELIPRQMFDVPDSGRHRRAHRGPRDGQGQAQGRAGQVLRR